MKIQEEFYTFNDLDELYTTAATLPTVCRHEIYAHHDADDEWRKLPYRSSLWTDDGRATGDVSSSDTFYNIIQYGDILDAVGKAVERQQTNHELDVEGRISLSPTAHKMSATIEFIGDTTVYAADDDPVDLGLKLRTGHSGFHALKYDVGAERQICSNGMMAFDARLHFEQTHREPFQPHLAYTAVESIVESPQRIEARIAEAQQQTLVNTDEALLVLFDLGIGDYLDQPLPDLVNALHDEVTDPDEPTLWETYNAATRALTHYARDVPDYDLDTGFERAASLLETGDAHLPDATSLGKRVVEERANQFIDDPDATEPYWSGEEDSLRRLMEDHYSRA